MSELTEIDYGPLTDLIGICKGDKGRDLHRNQMDSRKPIL
jgi:hypothetical protein